MLEKNVNDVSVALLSSLVKRGVPILLRQKQTNKEKQPPAIRSDALLPSETFPEEMRPSIDP